MTERCDECGNEIKTPYCVVLLETGSDDKVFCNMLCARDHATKLTEKYYKDELGEEG